MDGKRVALALGSGGARGYAHIGVIAELLDRGYEIVGLCRPVDYADRGVKVLVSEERWVE